GPVGLDLLQLSCRLKKRLRFDFPWSCHRVRRAGIGLSGMRHSLPRRYAKMRGYETAQVLYVVAFKIGLADVSVFVRIMANVVRYSPTQRCAEPQKSGEVCPPPLFFFR